MSETISTLARGYSTGERRSFLFWSAFLPFENNESALLFMRLVEFFENSLLFCKELNWQILWWQWNIIMIYKAKSF